MENAEALSTDRAIQPEYPRGLGFEQVWAMFQETDRLIKELREESKETDRHNEGNRPTA